jgi:hypothetical protein
VHEMTTDHATSAMSKRFTRMRIGER